MRDVAIRVEHLSKQYSIGRSQAPQYETIRDTIVNALSASARLLKSSKPERIWALQDISFEVNRGEPLGIIGRNGSGKTTLLKILSRITKPTEGRAKVYGRVGSLLEVGTGFHKELTGRENIYLNGAILGMRRKEINRRFEEIVEFGEIKKFLDTPVKYYSSGMYMRLAFAVAAHLDPEILLVDEVLAVGDVAFQRKCLGKMGDLSRSGRTVLFVSHNLGVIGQLCKRTLWLDNGRFVKMDSTPEVIHEYLEFSASSTTGTWTNSLSCANESDIKLVSASTITGAGVPVSVVRYDEGFFLEVYCEVVKCAEAWSLVFRIRDSMGTAVFTSWDTDSLGQNKPTAVGTYRVSCHVPGRLLRSGIYSVTLGIYFPRGEVFEIQEDVFRFEVSSVGYTMNSARLGVITPVLNWSVEGVTANTVNSNRS